MTMQPLPEPLVMVNRYGQGASTSDGDGGLFTADQMQAYAAAAVAAEREACALVCEDLEGFVYDDPGSSYAAAIRARSAV